MATKERTYDSGEIAELLQNLPGWSYDGGMLRREIKTDGWKSTMLMVNAIAYVSEVASHHPDLQVSWGRITIQLWTHSANGITDKDFATARLIDAAVTPRA